MENPIHNLSNDDLSGLLLKQTEELLKAIVRKDRLNTIQQMSEELKVIQKEIDRRASDKC